jgi:predicted AlkP superfamily phosphohydrolase/phosphomutase
LTGFRDEERGEVAIHRAFNAVKTYRGPYRADAPDIIVGYNKGYRVSWEAAIGQPTHRLFHDNTKAWSGDHCIDPALIPGVLFCNRKITADRPRLIDLGPTVLDMFGVDVPAHMDGRPLRVANANGAFPANGRNGRHGHSGVETVPSSGAAKSETGAPPA